MIHAPPPNGLQVLRAQLADVVFQFAGTHSHGVDPILDRASRFFRGERPEQPGGLPALQRRQQWMLPFHQELKMPKADLDGDGVAIAARVTHAEFEGSARFGVEKCHQLSERRRPARVVQQRHHEERQFDGCPAERPLKLPGIGNKGGGERFPNHLMPGPFGKFRRIEIRRENIVSDFRNHEFGVTGHCHIDVENTAIFRLVQILDQHPQFIVGQPVQLHAVEFVGQNETVA